jgi:hypothetical protein
MRSPTAAAADREVLAYQQGGRFVLKSPNAAGEWISAGAVVEGWA